VQKRKLRTGAPDAFFISNAVKMIADELGLKKSTTESKDSAA